MQSGLEGDHVNVLGCCPHVLVQKKAIQHSVRMSTNLCVRTQAPKYFTIMKHQASDQKLPKELDVYVPLGAVRECRQACATLQGKSWNTNNRETNERVPSGAELNLRKMPRPRMPRSARSRFGPRDSRTRCLAPNLSAGRRRPRQPHRTSMHPAGDSIASGRVGRH